MRSRGPWGWIVAGVAALALLGVILLHNVLASALLNLSTGAETGARLRWSRMARLLATGETRRRTLVTRAHLLEDVEDFEGALEEIESLSDPWTRLQRAGLLMRMDRNDEALEQLGRVLDEKDKSADLAQPALFYCAQIFEARGERHRARIAYESVAACGERTEWGIRALQALPRLRD